MAEWGERSGEKLKKTKRYYNGPHSGLKENTVELEQKDEQAVAEIDHMNQRFQRALDEQRVRERMMVVRDFLPVLDSMQRALKIQGGRDNPWFEGIKQTLNIFEKTLDHLDVQTVPGVGELFDPNVHEAVNTVEHSEWEEGRIHNVVEQGYMLGGILLRAAKVEVVKKR